MSLAPRPNHHQQQQQKQNHRKKKQNARTPSCRNDILLQYALYRSVSNNSQMDQQRSNQGRGGRRGGQRREVLSEEDYDATLSSIIQRDYFPESNALLHQNALLDKRLNGDVIGAVEVRRAVRRLREQELEAETRRLEDDNDLVSVSDQKNGTIVVSAATTSSSRIRKRARPLGEETITGFHARVTNEDDYEFESTQKEEVDRNRKRLHGVFNNSNNDNRGGQVQLQIEDELASDDFTAESNQLPTSDWRSHSQTNNAFFSLSAGDSLMPVDKDGERGGGGGDSTKKLAIENASSSGVSAGLMLPPSRQQTQSMIVRRQCDPSSSAVATTKPLAKHELVEYIPKNVQEEKMIDPSQTRFPQSHDGRIIIPGYYSNHNSNGSGGIVNLSSSSHGTDISDTDESLSVTDASQYGTDLDAPLRSIEEERKSRDRYNSRGYTGNSRKTKKDNSRSDPNYRPFVPMTPLNHPQTTTSSSIAMPSGHDGGLDHLSSKGSVFTLSEESQQEQAARHAEEELARRARRAKEASSSSLSKRKKKEYDDLSIASSSTIYSNRRKTESLTPAAMALLGKGAASKVQGRDEFSRSLRRSYTPKLSSSASLRSVTSSSIMNSRRKSNSSTSRSSRGSLRDHAFNSTPLSSRNGSK